MGSNAKLFSVGDFDFRLQHLLIIGILAIAVTTSALIRAQPAMYGLELHEFDPYFNYRATEFLVNNGYDAYLEWHDDKSWHPFGRDVSATSQVVLHLITASMYNVFGGGSSLYDFTIIFPLAMISITAVFIFALVRVIGGTTAGLIASLMFAIALPITARALIGWYKSEPLGLCLGIIGLYLFLSALKINKGKVSFIKMVFAGIFLSLGLSSWGGSQFFLLPISIFFVALPLLTKDNRFLLWAIPTFSASLLLTTLSFERPGVHFVFGYGTFLVLLPTAVMIVMIIIQKFSSVANRNRNPLLVLGVFAVLIIGVFATADVTEGYLFSGAIDLPSVRYFNALNPFMTSDDPLIASVSEHQATTLNEFFRSLSVFIIFGLIGGWLLFSNRTRNSSSLIPNHMKAFALIFGLLAIYISSAFARLELFGAIGLIILGALGLTILLQNVLDKQKFLIKIVFCVIIIGLMITPMMLPERGNWVTKAQIVPTILNGASFYQMATGDWRDATNWLKENTPDDSVVFTWWDYGYYIQTLGERTTLADNATIFTWQIEKIARTYMSPVDDAWAIIHSDSETNVAENYVIVPSNYETLIEQNNPEITGLDADYIAIFLAGERYFLDNGIVLYGLSGGGDESKVSWFARIAGVEERTFIERDGITLTPYGLHNSLIGQLIPFSPVTYIDPRTGNGSETYSPGLMPLYIKDIKLQDPDGPFNLVYASPSFSDESGRMITILIYQVNHDYSG